MAKMTLEAAKKELKAVGMTITKLDGEYRVNFRGADERSAYYTDDISDAVETGRKDAEKLRRKMEPKGRRYAVQFMQFIPGTMNPFGAFIECLRYAGTISVMKETPNDMPDGTWYVLRLYAPARVDTKVWAEQNVARMQSFGRNAEVVPEIQ